MPLAPAPPVPPSIAPPVQLSVPPIQLIVHHAQLIPTQLIKPADVPQLSWLHFKPEFADKPDEDAEAHLLRMNDWMDTHVFQESVKDQHFCLTLVGEARFWYESLKPIKVDRIMLKTSSGNNKLR